MSDFKFYGLDTVTHVNAGACTFTGTTITTSNDIADLGDMVYFQISETQGAVGVCTNTGTTFNVDTNVYSNIPSSFTPNGTTSFVYVFDETDDFLYDEVTSYRIENSISIATFSESYRPYNTNQDFRLLCNTQIRNLVGSLKTMLLKSYIIFKDTCDNKAYLVSFAGDTFVTLNNKFKSSLEFNIATR